MLSKPKMAVFICGIHYYEQYKNNNANKIIDVDFREYYQNIKSKFMDFFSKKYDIDIFISSNESKISDELNVYYSPKICHLRNIGKRASRILKIIELFNEYTKEHNINYDLIGILRFDIYFMENFNNIVLDNFNIVSILEIPNSVDDNVHIFPAYYLSKFYDIIKKVVEANPNICNLHNLRDIFEENFNVNYLENGNCFVRNLNFFKLCYNFEFIMNKTIFTENVKYTNTNNKNINMMIKNDVIYLNKTCQEKCQYAWIGYHIKHLGTYNISFEMLSNINLTNFNFIKTHNPEKYHCHNAQILALTWTKINITITLTSDDELLCFIFDLFMYCINVQFKNITIIKDNCNLNGIILNQLIDIDCQLLYKSGSVNLLLENKNDKNDKNIVKTNNEIFDKNIYLITKKQTNEIKPFLWFGYNILLEKITNKLSFDIMFLNKVPHANGNFCVKTHDPIQKYYLWLNECKINEYTTINLELCINKKEQLIIFIMDDLLDRCLFRIKNIHIKTDDKTINFISFFTQGYNKDKCLNLTESYSLYKNTITNYVDTTKFYRAEELKNNKDTEYLVKEFPDEPIHNAKTNLIGYLRWKPYIILETLKKSNYNDIIYYRDCNVKKYPEILEGIHETALLLNKLLLSEDIFFPIENNIKLKGHVKSEIFEYMKLNKKNYLEKYLLNASVIICRKSDLTIKFMEEWLELCKNDDLISSNYCPLIQNKNFKWNTQEQSIMNMLAYNFIDNNLLNYTFPNFRFIDRKISLQSIKKMPKIAILLAGEMRNFDNPNIISNNFDNLLGKYDCDLFISTWNKRGYSGYHGTIEYKPYNLNPISKEYIEDTYTNIKGINIEDYDVWYNNLNTNLKLFIKKGFKCGNKIIKATSFPQLYKIWDANRIKTEFEIKNNFKYDLVIRMRSDMCILETIPDEYLNDFFEKKIDDNEFKLNYKIWNLNPSKIFYPNRIYDIFFYGNSDSMNMLCNTWIYILEFINYPYDNGLEKIDCCRLLYICCVVYSIDVIDIKRCIGDIYRDEPFEQYINKIKCEYN
jgi:hypothetical protein